MIVVAVFLSLAILPTARAADETIWASDDPVENYSVAVDAVVKVLSADAVTDGPINSAEYLQALKEMQGWCSVKILRERLREDPDFLCKQSKLILHGLTAQSQILIAQAMYDRNFRVPAEVVAQIGIAFALRVVMAGICDFRATVCVEPR